MQKKPDRFPASAISFQKTRNHFMLLDINIEAS